MTAIGITGPIGCGKSTVARWLGERSGLAVIDADDVARLVLAPETPEVEAVYRRFGQDLRRPDGELDRARSAGWSSRIPTRCMTSKRSSIPPSGRGSSPRSSARSAAGAGPW